MKKIIPFMSFMLAAAPAARAAQQEALPDAGIERIGWAARCAGKMPDGLLFLIIALVILSVLTAVFCVNNRGEK